MLQEQLWVKRIGFFFKYLLTFILSFFLISEQFPYIHIDFVPQMRRWKDRYLQIIGEY